MSALPFKYPLFAFGRDVGRNAQAGRETVTWFGDDEDVSTCKGWDLKHGARMGMILVDPTGRCWEIVGVKDLGIVGSVLGRIVRFVFQQNDHAIEMDLAERPPMSLDQVKDRVCASIDANPDDWRDDEAIAGESGEPQDELELLDRLKSRVRKAKTLKGVVKILDR